MMQKNGKFQNSDFFSENSKSTSNFQRPFMPMRGGGMGDTPINDNPFASPVFQSATNASFTSGAKTFQEHFSSKHSSRHNSSDEEYNPFEAKRIGFIITTSP